LTFKCFFVITEKVLDNPCFSFYDLFGKEEIMKRLVLLFVVVAILVGCASAPPPPLPPQPVSAPVPADRWLRFRASVEVGEVLRASILEVDSTGVVDTLVVTIASKDTTVAIIRKPDGLKWGGDSFEISTCAQWNKEKKEAWVEQKSDSLIVFGKYSRGDSTIAKTEPIISVPGR
jgi:hypothetical protein